MIKLDTIAYYCCDWTSFHRFWMKLNSSFRLRYQWRRQPSFSHDHFWIQQPRTIQSVEMIFHLYENCQSNQPQINTRNTINYWLMPVEIVRKSPFLLMKSRHFCSFLSSQKFYGSKHPKLANLPPNQSRESIVPGKALGMGSNGRGTCFTYQPGWPLGSKKQRQPNLGSVTPLEALRPL